MAAAEPNLPVSRIESEVKRIRALLERRQFPEALAVSEALFVNSKVAQIPPVVSMRLVMGRDRLGNRSNPWRHGLVVRWFDLRLSFRFGHEFETRGDLVFELMAIRPRVPSGFIHLLNFHPAFKEGLKCGQGGVQGSEVWEGQTKFCDSCVRRFRQILQLSFRGGDGFFGFPQCLFS